MANISLTQTGGGAGSGGSGTVTSVALSLGGSSSDALYAVTGTPITTTGTLALALASQSANLVFASPNGSSGTPGFRSLVTTDFPTSGTWPFAGTLSGSLTISGTTLHTATDTLGLSSYTTGISNSSSLVLSGSYESASTPTYAQDSWTLQNVIGTGVNGSAYLTLSHSGTSGPNGLAVAAITTSAGTSAPIVTGGIAFSGTLATGASSLASFGAINSSTFGFYPSSSTSTNQALTLNFATNAATTNNQTSWTMSFTPNNGNNAMFSLSAQLNVNGQNLVLAAGMGTSTVAPGILLGGNGGNNSKDFSATSGTQVAVSVGGMAGQGRVQFTPASGSANFVGLQVAPIINQTGSASGSYTALKLSVTETALLGSSNKLIDCFAGSAGTTEVFAVDNTGKVIFPTTTNTATSATAGSNGAVPAQVAGYLVITINGVNYKLPYFAV
jgi:hypothetical protein